MTRLIARDLREVVEVVWTVTLGFEVLDAVGSLPPPAASTWCGCVRVVGGWSGLVKLSMAEVLARQAAAVMFGAPPESLSNDDLIDALGELTNVTGGNVKALLPGPSQLSLPSVVAGADLAHVAPGESVLCEVAFQTGGSQIRAQVVEGPGAANWSDASSPRTGLYVQR